MMEGEGCSWQSRGVQGPRAHGFQVREGLGLLMGSCQRPASRSCSLSWGPSFETVGREPGRSGII